MLARNVSFSYDPLMAFARDPEDPLTCTFASALELARSSSRLVGRGAFGLNLSEFTALLNEFFPGAQAVYLTPAFRASLLAGADRCIAVDEFEDVVGLLLEHRRDDAPQTLWLAHAIAACCMGDDHLWQDMGLSDRKTLSDLLADHFGTLFARNTESMRWKKFFYKQLCERNGAFVCRSPSCAECSEYNNCFGPEEDSTWQLQKR